jgi:hypothetical protein
MGGIAALRFPNVILLSQNVRGYSSKQSSSKKDHILRILRTFSDTPSILFTQETWPDNDQNLELDNTLFFSHMAQHQTTPPNEASESYYPHLQYWRGNWLDSQNQSTQERLQVQLESWQSNCISETMQTRLPNKLYAISAYLLCSSYRNNKYEATLTDLDKIMQKCPADATPIIGSDFKASIGTANATEDLFSSPVGRHGNSHRNDSGDKLRDFMNRHELCSIATFFEKQRHNTWSFNGDGERLYQIDHILAKRKGLKKFTDCDTIAGAESDHTPVAAIM